MKRKPKAIAPAPAGESSGAGYDLVGLVPTKRAHDPLASHQQLQSINDDGVVGFRWQIRFDGV